MSYLGKYLMMSTTIAYAVIDGVTARGEKGNYSTQRVKFNSNAYS
jgi:putative transposase